MNIPIPYQSLVTMVIDTSRRFLEEGQELAPVVFIGNSHKDQFEVVQIVPGFSEEFKKESKDAVAAMIRERCKEMSADMVLMVAEAWVLDSAQTKNAEAILRRYGSVANCPFRIDSVSFALETKAGNWMGTAEITPKGDKRTFAEVTFTKSKEASGRFTHFLT